MLPYNKFFVIWEVNLMRCQDSYVVLLSNAKKKPFLCIVKQWDVSLHIISDSRVSRCLWVIVFSTKDLGFDFLIYSHYKSQGKVCSNLGVIKKAENMYMDWLITYASTLAGLLFVHNSRFDIINSYAYGHFG